MKPKNGSVIGCMICVVVCAVALLALCVFAPTLVTWYYREVRAMPQPVVPVLLDFYACVPFAALALVSLWRLLGRIRQGEILVPANVRSLGILSWMALAVAVLSLGCGVAYPPLFVVCAAGGFMALILRVVRQVFCYAVGVKAENELTV